MSNEILDKLRLPFHPAQVEWKPGSLNGDKTRALAIAYADVRAYQNRLDEVCGLGWSVTYTPWGDRIVCHVTIDGVTRSSTGEGDSQSERSEIAGTAAEAQAFKRACAMFGLGRYLYNLPTLWVEFEAGSKAFSERARARLDMIVNQHYRRVMDGQDADAQTTGNGEQSIKADHPFDNPTAGASAEPTLPYDQIAEALDGNCRKLAEWAMAQHASGNGPASKPQYGFLAKAIDNATNGAHTVVLSVLIRRHVTGDNPCSKDLASKLLDYLLPKVAQKDERNQPIKVDGKSVWIDNPKFRPEYVECLKEIAQKVEAWRTKAQEPVAA